MKLIPEGRRGKILLSACIVLVISLAAALTLGVLLAGGCDGGKNGGDSDAYADGKTSADSTVFQESDAGNAADTDTAAGGDPWKACREQGLSVSELFAYTGPNPDCGFDRATILPLLRWKTPRANICFVPRSQLLPTTEPSTALPYRRWRTEAG